MFFFQQKKEPAEAVFGFKRRNWLSPAIQRIKVIGDIHFTLLKYGPTSNGPTSNEEVCSAMLIFSNTNSSKAAEIQLSSRHVLFCFHL